MFLVISVFCLFVFFLINVPYIQIGIIIILHPVHFLLENCNSRLEGILIQT